MRNFAATDSIKPKEEQTAYERWEMSQFTESDSSIGRAKST